MLYVYLLQCIAEPDRYYVGLTGEPARRLEEHNSGMSIHTSKFRPWKMTVCVGFADPAKATAAGA
mgnify:CR=1 FL=1